MARNDEVGERIVDAIEDISTVTDDISQAIEAQTQFLRQQEAGQWRKDTASNIRGLGNATFIGLVIAQAFLEAFELTLAFGGILFLALAYFVARHIEKGGETEWKP